ncbi:MAG: methyltransferase domain-containing protein [Candidatus Manganitrophaceae bacterium]|nr:MAG: methyltransferase domain-containing protein [Candidatus Manganitrophaceae bacterium]
MAQMSPEEIIDQQRQDWSRVAPAWEKWDALLHQNLSFLNHRLVGDARIRPGQRVLDLGSGTGYPAIVAADAVGNQGEVLGLDLSEEMLDRAKRKAYGLGLFNLDFRVADATHLSEGDGSFDAVISRFCLMFLPDVPKAVAEIARVLKPGGYLAAAVWSVPDQNPFIRIPMEVLRRFIDLPTPPPGQPGIFRLAKPGDLSGMAEQAGLQKLGDDEIQADSFYDSADTYWTNLLDMAAPLQPLFAKLSAKDRGEAERQIKEAVEQFRKGEEIALPMAIRIVVARKPF